jgi:N4-gp56 family major capsid protein
MVTGSTKIGTTTIKAARYIYVPQEMIPTLEDMTHNGKVVWQDVADYADGGSVSNSVAESVTNVGEGEVGRIGSFRFITVFDMPVFRGEGGDATDGTDNDGDGLEDSSAGFYVTDGKYDVFPMLVVGSDSFETYSLEGDVAKVKHGAPQVNPVSDPHGDIGSIAIAWYFGLLLNKPEHIRVLLSSASF